MTTTRLSILPLALAGFVLLALPGLGSATGLPQRPQAFALTADDHQATAAKVAMLFMTRVHYRPHPLDDTFSAVVFDKLVEDLDPQRAMFTKGDIARFEPLRPTLGKGIEDGNLSAAMAPVNVYLSRIVEQARFSQSLLDGGFDFSAHESITVDRKAAPWPEDSDELRALWRLHVKDDWLRLKLAGKDDVAIRATLARRYRNLESRVQKTTAEDAFQLFMTAYAESTDPHTDYFAPRAASEFNTAMSLSLDGIGAYLRAHDEYVEVTELVAGSPAATSGKVHVGDRLTGVGQGAGGTLTDVIGWRTDDVVTLVRGRAGTNVRLELLPDEHKGDVAPHIVTLTRRRVTIEDQAARQGIIDVGVPGHPQKIGVITVPSFYEDFDARRAGDANYRSVTRDVSAMLVALKGAKVDGIVIDLRNNGGGSLGEAAGMVGLFTGPGPVVQVRSANGDVDLQGTPGTPAVWHGPVTVMVNHASASASEIFAAALQDRGRAVIVGERTFGKGTVQNLVDLGDALGRSKDEKLGELKMTIAQFYRINGRSTQLEGVTPDIAFPETPGEQDLGESMYKNALPASRIAPVAYSRDVTDAARIALLVRTHESRITTTPAWQLQLEESAAFTAMAKRPTVSLNLAERKATRDADLGRYAAFAARQKALDRAAGVTGREDAPVADDGLDPTERDAAADKRPDAAKSPADAYLQEAAHISEDSASLLMTVAGEAG
ncbi:carboxy terminal-processing peptidase [Luteibacter aegosomatissinici]|uniref:carboxy terminal-processing peptidase n=1 Tax=Luteibacter aegosomatissinici TaxID=2911539 RepID=UPI001FF8CCAD|nr:carboxy terminal-processing peptidase [Luteibacter aegosomatissinici]UPG92711.1 carboxy terminal-processing peptidase [Luteibacter aegosomatissinici]